MTPNTPDGPSKGHRTEPERRLAHGDAAEPEAIECPECHATNPGDSAFCGSCGHDFITGVSPQEQTDPDDDDEDPAPLRPTAWQAAEPHEVYIDPRRDADDIELPTRAEDVALDSEDLARRPDVPPPTPPSPAHEHIAHDLPENLPPSRQRSAEWVAEVWIDHAWAARTDSEQPVPETGLPTVVRLSRDNVVIGRTNLERGMHPDLDAGTDAGVSIRHAQLTTDGHRWWVEDLDTSNGTFVTTVGMDLPETPIERGQRIRVDEDDRIYLGGWTRIMLRRVLEATPRA